MRGLEEGPHLEVDSVAGSDEDEAAAGEEHGEVPGELEDRELRGQAAPQKKRHS